jgi:hypothetical protein
MMFFNIINNIINYRDHFITNIKHLIELYAIVFVIIIFSILF